MENVKYDPGSFSRFEPNARKTHTFKKKTGFPASEDNFDLGVED
jgi:hypothetical protein